MNLGTFKKQPRERISVSIIYTDALDEGDSLGQIELCTAEPAGLSATALLADLDRVRVFASGGLSGVKYQITVLVHTAYGERLESEVYCQVKEI
jgi:hypothetical protein